MAAGDSDRAHVSADEFSDPFGALSTWGRWGTDDQRGALHHLTPERVAAAAAACVRRATCAMGLLLGFVLDLLGLLPSGFSVGESGLADLATVNDSTVVVALAAGVAGMLALETRASSAVGVAISITTIPAAAYLGVAAGVGEAHKVPGAAAVLGVNVAMLLLAGTATLVVQRRLARLGG